MAIWGSNTPSTTYRRLLKATAPRYVFKLVAPSSGLLIGTSVYCRAEYVSNTYGYDIGVTVYNSSRVATRSLPAAELKYSGMDQWAWRSYDISTYNVSIISGQTYYFSLSGSCIYSSTGGQIGYIVGSPNISNIVVTPYSPAIPDPLTQSDLFSFYFTYTPTTPPGPALKIEGITPGKLEGTAWSNISTIR